MCQTMLFSCVTKQRSGGYDGRLHGLEAPQEIITNKALSKLYGTAMRELHGGWCLIKIERADGAFSDRHPYRNDSNRITIYSSVRCIALQYTTDQVSHH